MKTLYISVFDTVGVSDNKGKKRFEVIQSDFVFSEYIADLRKELFSNVKHFCRPPTAININRLIPKNHLAI